VKKLILFLTLFIIVTKSYSQIEILKDNGSWLTYSTNVKLSKKFYFGNIFQMRRVHFLKETQGYLLAPSLNYKISKATVLGSGYLYFNYFPNGVSHSYLHKNEHRFWQSITLNSFLNNTKISHRFMFEERIIDRIKTIENSQVIDGTKYAQRFRYKMQITFNLFQLKNNKNLLGKVSNEFRIRFNTGISQPDFDQNNFSLLAGYQFLKDATFWIGYGNYYFKSNSQKFILNNILHCTLSTHFDLTKHS